MDKIRFVNFHCIFNVGKIKNKNDLYETFFENKIVPKKAYNLSTHIYIEALLLKPENAYGMVNSMQPDFELH